MRRCLGHSQYLATRFACGCGRILEPHVSVQLLFRTVQVDGRSLAFPDRLSSAQDRMIRSCNAT